MKQKIKIPKTKQEILSLKEIRENADFKKSKKLKALKELESLFK